MKTFEISLKNEKEKYYRLIILLFVILHALYFSYLLFDASLWKKGVAGLIFILLYSGYRLVITNTSKQKFSYGSGFFILFSLFTSIRWLSIIDFVLMIFSTLALQKIIFIFNKSEVNTQNFPWKKYKWEEFSNLVLKDNILTLDFRNNKLIQAEIETKNIDEAAFNTFAKEHLVNNT